MGKFTTNAIGAIWWSNLESICKWQNWQPMQVAPSGGQICSQFKKFHWNQFQTILVERFTQVMDSIPWVRCASGNVLWRHLKTHNGEKSNKCNQSDYASFKAGNLRTHLKTHSGEKLNKCNQCDFAYDLIYQSNLPSLPTYLTFLPDQPTCF